MNETILKQSRDLLAEKRRANIERHEYELSQAKKSPLYQTADQVIRLNTLEISRCLARGEDITAQEKKLAYLKSEFEKLKATLGVTPDYFDCNICEDTGQLKDGTMCNCLKQLYNKLATIASGVNDLPNFRFSDNKIDDIDCHQQNKLSKLYTSMQRYCDTFPNTNVQNIVLTGNIGVGKSCLLSAVAHDLIEKGFHVQYLTAFSLANAFLKYHTSDVKVREQYINDILNCDILMIDDLGTEPILKNVTVEYLYCVLEARKSKHTIVATNLCLTELTDRYGERIVSRLTNKNTTSLSLVGDDLRIKK